MVVFHFKLDSQIQIFKQFSCSFEFQGGMGLATQLRGTNEGTPEFTDNLQSQALLTGI